VEIIQIISAEKEYPENPLKSRGNNSNLRK
jgi:hypothetical protein